MSTEAKIATGVVLAVLIIPVVWFDWSTERHREEAAARRPPVARAPLEAGRPTTETERPKGLPCDPCCDEVAAFHEVDLKPWDAGGETRWGDAFARIDIEPSGGVRCGLLRVMPSMKFILGWKSEEVGCALREGAMAELWAMWIEANPIATAVELVDMGGNLLGSQSARAPYHCP